MNSISDTFDRLKKDGKCALMPYFMANYPDSETFSNLLIAAQKSGADLIEVGLPFSDPIADGPTIQEAGQVAIRNDATVQNVFDLLRDLPRSFSVPLMIMSYTNLFLQYGLDRFFETAARAGIRGAVIPDLSLEESGPYREAAGKHGIDLIQFVTPTTHKSRLAAVAETARGFIYLVSVTGVTGARPEKKDFGLQDQIENIRASTDMPVCIGFGIATPEQAAAMARLVDGVIIGSAIIDIIKQHPISDAPAAVENFLRQVRNKIDS
ncbi:MAG: tryptophan synthase subunit alpha [Planctomycetota bacterium]|nr:MAG: tryptophan synthase subunit alpha [Planctomycetota bacterium]